MTHDSNKSPPQWTTPYCGVRHLQNAPSTHQITVVDRGAFAEAYVLSLRGHHTFTPVAEGTFETVYEAQRWAQGKAESL
jgi:hypothetical protein